MIMYKLEKQQHWSAKRDFANYSHIQTNSFAYQQYIQACNFTSLGNKWNNTAALLHDLTL